ncbi:MAG: adenylate kinase [Tenericutes bacterium]|nr:adenylate kinase [Mycoplasmatota bacterium]
MKNIIFIAPPAAGKGTQSELLISKYGYEHISTGDLLRNEIKSGSDLGKELDSMMKSGSLISDEIVNKLLINALSNITKPFILDGYPRTISQALKLDEILASLNKSVDVVVYLDVEEELAMKRATGRLSCKSCNRIYHKYFSKPRVEGICDNCGSSLISRADDTPDTFKVRYDTYMSNTKPLLDFYSNKNILVKVDANKEADETFREIEKVIG